jgi:hypothetical protein
MTVFESRFGGFTWVTSHFGDTDRVYGGQYESESEALEGLFRVVREG